MEHSSMNRKLVERLAISRGIYDCLCDPYDKHKTGDYYGSIMDDLERYTELVVQECLAVINQPNGVSDEDVIRISRDVKQHFGVEE